jgi:Chs5-Arf1p-binding protein BUD7/BCH1
MPLLQPQANRYPSRITEEVSHESVETRTESLVSLRELGPPDLVHLLRQPARAATKPVGSHTETTSGTPPYVSALLTAGA